MCVLASECPAEARPRARLGRGHLHRRQAYDRGRRATLSLLVAEPTDRGRNRAPHRVPAGTALTGARPGGTSPVTRRPPALAGICGDEAAGSSAQAPAVSMARPRAPPAPPAPSAVAPRSGPGCAPATTPASFFWRSAWHWRDAHTCCRAPTRKSGVNHLGRAGTGACAAYAEPCIMPGASLSSLTAPPPATTSAGGRPFFLNTGVPRPQGWTIFREHRRVDSRER
jgi:hypothetical protein